MLNTTASCKMEQPRQALAEKGLLGHRAPVPGEDLVQRQQFGAAQVFLLFMAMQLLDKEILLAVADISGGICLQK